MIDTNQDPKPYTPNPTPYAPNPKPCMRVPPGKKPQRYKSAGGGFQGAQGENLDARSNLGPLD